jgi:hypothetical protein
MMRCPARGEISRPEGDSKSNSGCRTLRSMAKVAKFKRILDADVAIVLSPIPTDQMRVT